MRILWTVPLVLTAVLLASGDAHPRDGGAEQGPLTLAVDVDPAGNTATSVGTIEDCVSVDVDSTFGVDIAVMNVANLLAWEATFVYDSAVLEVVGADVSLFQAANAGSSVIDASEPLPDADGRFFVGGIESGSALDSGSGVLARLTLRAIGPGISAASLPKLDFNDDGVPDHGSPVLAAVVFKAAVYLGDIDGDEIYDGQVRHGAVAVGQGCPPGDLDGDGFSDDREALHLGTDPNKGCASTGSGNDEALPDAWPPDNDDDQDADIGDVIALFGGRINRPASYSARSDADGDGDNDTGDVIAIYGGGNMLLHCA